MNGVRLWHSVKTYSVVAVVALALFLAISAVMNWRAKRDSLPEILYEFPTPDKSGCSSLAVNPSYSVLAVGCYNGRVRLYDLKTHVFRERYLGGMGAVYAMTFLSDRELVTGGSDRRVKIWNIESGEETTTFAGHEGRVRAVAIVPETDLLLSGGDDGLVHIWNLQTKQPEEPLKGPVFGIESLTVSPDGKRIACGTGDREIIVWDFENRKVFWVFQGYTEKKWAPGVGLPVFLESSDRMALVRRETGCIEVFDFIENRVIERSEAISPFVKRLQANHDYTEIITTDEDGTLAVWSRKNGKILNSWEAHNAISPALALLDPGGTIIASGAGGTNLYDHEISGEIKIWRRK